MSERTCKVEGCERPYRAMGWCGTHYAALRFANDNCSVEGCPNHPRSSGLCNRHIDKRRGPCGVEGCIRPRRAKGLCPQHYRESDERQRECRECGKRFSGDIRRNFCSRPCKHLWMKGPVRRAVEAGDWPGVITAARECSTITAAGCWEWNFAKSGAGYGMIGQGGRGGLVHRHVAAAVLGRSIPKTEPVHHKCANPPCVNPDHLQPVTTRENIAEMFERNHYLARIASLEAALMTVAPNHPLIAGEFTVTSGTETSTFS